MARDKFSYPTRFRRRKGKASIALARERLLEALIRRVCQDMVHVFMKTVGSNASYDTNPGTTLDKGVVLLRTLIVSYFQLASGLSCTVCFVLVVR